MITNSSEVSNIESFSIEIYFVFCPANLNAELTLNVAESSLITCKSSPYHNSQVYLEDENVTYCIILNDIIVLHPLAPVILDAKTIAPVLADNFKISFVVPPDLQRM